MTLMTLPDFADLRVLENLHPEYKALAETWQTIQELRYGAPVLENIREKYIPRRPGEDPELYNLRLRKFSYTPVMASAIRDFVAKLTSAPVHLSELDLTDPFWTQFLNTVDGDRQDQSELLINLFNSLVYFGRVAIGVDLPPATPARSLLESSMVTPVCTVYEPLEVVNWGKTWYLTRQLEFDSNPLDTVHAIVATWVFWTSEETVVYSAPVGMDTEGRITSATLQGIRVPIGSAKIPAVSRVSHGLGRPSLVHLKLPDHLWIGSQVYLKQKQHTLIENSWTDTGSIAGMVQRVFTPTPPVVNDDPRYTTTPQDYSAIKTGNPYVLIGDRFEFSEASGTAIESLTKQLETIERQIKELVAMGFATGSDKGNLEQSGLSKMVDQTLLEDNLKTFGRKGIQVYQDVLQLVARLSGRSEEPIVSGLDQYATDSLDEMVKATEGLMLAADYIPDTAWRHWFGKLSTLMVGSVAPEVLEEIDVELEAIFNSDEPVVVSPGSEEPEETEEL